MTKFILGDVVQVRSGAQKGQQGAILKITKDGSRVVLEGVNERTRTRKARGDQPGSSEEFYAPIHISNVSAVDAKGKLSRLGFTYENGAKTRTLKTTGKAVEGKLVAAKPKAKKKTTKKVTETEA